MIIRYIKSDGSFAELKLSSTPVTIGRSPDADIMIAQERISRIHCGISYEEGQYILKDLESKNGTFVNGENVTERALQPGDKIKVGSSILSFEQELGKGVNTVMREVEGEFTSGKGYNTILREIVDATDEGAGTD